MRNRMTKSLGAAAQPSGSAHTASRVIVPEGSHQRLSGLVRHRSCPTFNKLEVSRETHNPKVGGSNPPPRNHEPQCPIATSLINTGRLISKARSGHPSNFQKH